MKGAECLLPDEKVLMRFGAFRSDTCSPSTRSLAMEIRTRTILCSDFAEWKTDLETVGYQILDHAPDPRQPGYCTLRFEADDHLPGPAPGPALGPARTAALAPATLDADQKRAAQAIVNIFETGAVLGIYGQVTVIPGDTGHLTFGRSQTTLSTGNLARLIAAYCDAPGARFATRLKPFLPKLRDCDTSLDRDLKLHNLLRASADDPLMRSTQDEFFDRTYWQPAVAEAAAAQLHTPLGIATVYDSVVHGSWRRLREATEAKYGIVARLGEQKWIKAYIETRREWLAMHARLDLRATVYRMEALKGLAEHGNWNLELPMLVRDLEISTASLAAEPPGCFDGPAPGSRVLSVASPFARGLDVRLVQLGLSDAGIEIKADGVFGSGSSTAVKQYQQNTGLRATGVADIELVKRLAV
jgi:chitosanase